MNFFSFKNSLHFFNHNTITQCEVRCKQRDWEHLLLLLLQLLLMVHAAAAADDVTDDDDVVCVNMLRRDR